MTLVTKLQHLLRSVMPEPPRPPPVVAADAVAVAAEPGGAPAEVQLHKGPYLQWPGPGEMTVVWEQGVAQAVAAELEVRRNKTKAVPIITLQPAMLCSLDSYRK
jgi:hypothetical protein